MRKGSITEHYIFTDKEEDSIWEEEVISVTTMV